jgi:hypothetical protein
MAASVRPSIEFESALIHAKESRAPASQRTESTDHLNQKLLDNYDGS